MNPSFVIWYNGCGFPLSSKWVPTADSVAGGIWRYLFGSRSLTVGVKNPRPESRGIAYNPMAARSAASSSVPLMMRTQLTGSIS